MDPLQETRSARTAAIPTATISHGSRRSDHISQVKQLSSFDFLFVFDFHCLAFTLAMAERVNRGRNMSVTSAHALFSDSGDNGVRHHRQSDKLRACRSHPNQVCSSVKDHGRAAASAGSRSLSAGFGVVLSWMKSVRKHPVNSARIVVGTCMFPEKVWKRFAEHGLLIRDKAQSLEVHIERNCQ